MQRNTTTDEISRVAAETGGDLRDAAVLTYEELRAQVAMLKTDLASLAEATRSAGSETARSARAGAWRMGGKAAEAAAEGYDIANARFEDAQDGAGRFVRARPALALGLAAGGGFLLAMLLKRR